MGCAHIKKLQEFVYFLGVPFGPRLASILMRRVWHRYEAVEELYRNQEIPKRLPKGPLTLTRGSTQLIGGLKVASFFLSP
jgi:hypothetical protein